MTAPEALFASVCIVTQFVTLIAILYILNR